MLRFLLSSGILFQGIKEDIAARVSRATTSLVFIICALVFIHGALVAFGVAAAFALTPYMGAPGAIALVGLVVHIIGNILVLLAKREPRQKRPVSPAAPAAAASGLAMLPDFDKLVRSAPVPLMIGAVLLGLLLGRRQGGYDE
jgi:hypothetical protein